MIPLNPAERLVYRTLVLTWPFYAIGALYVVGPVLAWLLGGAGGPVTLSWPRNAP